MLSNLKIELSGLIVITPHRHGDHRGFFAETYSQRAYAALGVDATFVQDNHSVSAAVGTVRGLHFQAPPHAQAKLVRCGQGAIFDVAVDIRRGSPTYGRWAGYTLSAKNGAQLIFRWALPMALPRSSLTARLSTNVAIITPRKPRARCAGMTRILASNGPSPARRC